MSHPPTPQQRAAPNDAHRAVADLQHAGVVSHVITQNVDRLHQRAGSSSVLELHGTIHQVSCQDCHASYARGSVQQWMARRNARWLVAYADSTVVRPDGDADLPEGAYAEFEPPECRMCGSTFMKPDVVFHGGNIPPPVNARAAELITHSDGVLVCGSSLTVWSALRLAKLAVDDGKPCVIFTYGDTRADDFCSAKYLGSVSYGLKQMVKRRVSK